MYQADLEVIASCEARGDTTITARKLERWRQQPGVLPRRPVARTIGKRGTSSVSPSGYVGRVLAVSAAVRSGLALRHVPIALFTDGHSVDLEALRASYLDLFGSMSKMSAGAGVKPGDDPLDQADALGRAMAGHLGGSMLAPMARRARKVAKQAGQRGGDAPRLLLESALSAALSGLWAGEAPSLEGTEELLTLIGLKDGQDVATSARHLGETSLETIEAAVHMAREEQWQTAREMSDLIIRYFGSRHRGEELTLPLELRLPGLEMQIPDDAFSRGCLIPQLLGVGEDTVAAARQHAAETEAFERLALQLSAEYRSYIHPRTVAAVAGRDVEFRTGFAAQVRSWVAANPADARLLGFNLDDSSAEASPAN